MMVHPWLCFCYFQILVSFQFIHHSCMGIPPPSAQEVSTWSQKHHHLATCPSQTSLQCASTPANQEECMRIQMARFSLATERMMPFKTKKHNSPNPFSYNRAAGMNLTQIQFAKRNSSCRKASKPQKCKAQVRTSRMFSTDPWLQKTLLLTRLPEEATDCNCQEAFEYKFYN